MIAPQLNLSSNPQKPYTKAPDFPSLPTKSLINTIPVFKLIDKLIPLTNATG